MKRFRDIFIGLMCLCCGIYMVMTNDYNEIAIVIMSVVSFVYCSIGGKI